MSHVGFTPVQIVRLGSRSSSQSRRSPKQFLAYLVDRYSANRTAKILSGEEEFIVLSKKDQAELQRHFPDFFSISPATLCKWAKEEGVELHVGRPYPNWAKTFGPNGQRNQYRNPNKPKSKKVKRDIIDEIQASIKEIQTKIDRCLNRR